MNYVKAANAEDLQDDMIVPVEVDGRKLLLAKVRGEYFAAQRKCPHLGFNLCKGKIEGHAVVCPLHKAKFDLRTGQIERDPKLLFIAMKAKSDLQTYAVREQGGDILIAI